MNNVVRAPRARPIATRRRLPPWGREVMDAIGAGRAVNVRVFASRPDPWPIAVAHRKAHGPGTALLLPPDAEPEQFDWPNADGVVAVITGLSGDTVQRLARELLAAGNPIVWLLDADNPSRNAMVRARRPSA